MDPEQLAAGKKTTSWPMPLLRLLRLHLHGHGHGHGHGHLPAPHPKMLEAVDGSD
jgi:hypothetical protein